MQCKAKIWQICRNGPQNGCLQMVTLLLIKLYLIHSSNTSHINNIKTCSAVSFTSSTHYRHVIINWDSSTHSLR